MMKLFSWFRKVGNRIRTFFVQLGTVVRGWWQGLTARLRRLFRREDKSSSGTTDAATTGRSRLDRARGVLRGAVGTVGTVSTRVWQRSAAFGSRVFRGTVTNAGLTIRKIGVKRAFQYNRDPSDLRQLLADWANALAIVAGVGLWPYLRYWSDQHLAPALAPHGWIVALLLAVLPLFVVYRRWQTIRQERHGADWDILTLATAVVGIFGILFALLLLLAALTPLALRWATVVCAALATLAWLWGEAVNLYTILIRRPYTLSALLSLSKSLLFLLSGWLILVYLPLVVLWAGTIQLESATFLLVIFVAAALLGLVVASTRYIVDRFQVRLPRFAAP